VSAIAVIDISKLILHAYQLNASDVHLSTNENPVFRIFGELKRLKEVEPFSSNDLQKSLEILFGQIGFTPPTNKKEVDFSFGVKDLIRIRANVYFERRNYAAAFRIITKKIRKLEDLNVPILLRELAERDRGMILVSGPTGSGKSTTIAAMIEHVNESKPLHILTIEDPVEYVFENKMSIIHQRELGLDTLSFADGLKYALRQDPDVILVGEMRDLDTMELALTAAETGHLVLATIHTNSAPTAPERVIDVFPAHQQKQVGLQLANSLIAVIYQRLVRQVGGKGFAPVLEIMMVTDAIRNLIREGKLHQIESLMDTGKKYGMISFDYALIDAVKQKKISKEDAFLYCRSVEKMTKELGPLSEALRE